MATALRRLNKTLRNKQKINKENSKNLKRKNSYNGNHW